MWPQLLLYLMPDINYRLRLEVNLLNLGCPMQYHFLCAATSHVYLMHIKCWLGWK
jgi:hypothetical protein